MHKYFLTNTKHSYKHALIDIERPKEHNSVHNRRDHIIRERVQTYKCEDGDCYNMKNSYENDCKTSVLLPGQTSAAC